MRQMREHGTPGPIGPAASPAGGATVRSAPDRDRAEGGVIGIGGENASTRAARAEVPAKVTQDLSATSAAARTDARVRKGVADFPQLLPARNSQITFGLLYRCSEARTGESKRGCHARARCHRRSSSRVGHRGLVDADRGLHAGRLARLLHVSFELSTTRAVGKLRPRPARTEVISRQPLCRRHSSAAHVLDCGDVAAKARRSSPGSRFGSGLRTRWGQGATCRVRSMRLVRIAGCGFPRAPAPPTM